MIMMMIVDACNEAKRTHIHDGSELVISFSCFLSYISCLFVVIIVANHNVSYNLVKMDSKTRLFIAPYKRTHQGYLSLLASARQNASTR